MPWNRPASRLGCLIRQWFSICLQTLDALVFPWKCQICHRVGAEVQGPLCQDCRAELLHASARAAITACPRCALPVGPFADLRGGCSRCRDHALGYDSALALGNYEGSLRFLCLRLKQVRNAWLASWLSELLIEARRTALVHLPHDTWVVPIPLHWLRRVERGYNQSEAMARGLAHGLGLQYFSPLRRIKLSHRLAELGATERKKALQGAFLCRKDARIVGRTVLLIDDILTTGATSGAAARALKKAGAKHVIVIVLARTV
jgi:ComF family protein